MSSLSTAPSFAFITQIFDQAETALKQDRLQVATEHTAAAAGRTAPGKAEALQRELEAATKRASEQQDSEGYRSRNRPLPAPVVADDPFMGGVDAATNSGLANLVVVVPAIDDARSNNVRDDHADDDDNKNREDIDQNDDNVTSSSGSQSVLARKQAAEIHLPTRLPVAVLQQILEEGLRYLKVMTKVLEQLHLHSAARGAHIHSFNNNNSSNSARSGGAGTLVPIQTPPDSKFLKAFAKIAETGPNNFPRLFEHLLGVVSRSQQTMCALAVFADCSGPAVLVDRGALLRVQQSSASTSAAGVLLLDRSNKDSSSSSASASTSTSSASSTVFLFVNATVNALAVKAIPEQLRRQAELAVFQAAVDCGRIEHSCPLTLVEMLRSRGEWNAKLGECICREMERLHREVLAFEERVRRGNGDAKNDEAMINQEIELRELIQRRSGGLRAVYDAQMSVQNILTERYSVSSSPISATNSLSASTAAGEHNPAAALAGSWLVFVRNQIAPRVLRWVLQLVDPATAGVDQRNNNNNNTSLSDEALWVAFRRVYEHVLVPSMAGIPCDSVRTVLYRCLLIFENRMRRQHHVTAGARGNDGSQQTSVAGGNVFASSASSSSSASAAGLSMSSSTIAGRKSLLELASDALLNKCGAAVYASNFLAPTGGHTIYIAEKASSSLTSSTSISVQFYVTEALAIFAKRGKLQSTAAFQKLESIDALCKLLA